MPSIWRRSSLKRRGAVAEQLDDEQRPLVGEAIEQVADLARHRPLTAGSVAVVRRLPVPPGVTE